MQLNINNYDDNSFDIEEMNNLASSIFKTIILITIILITIIDIIQILRIIYVYKKNK